MKTNELDDIMIYLASPIRPTGNQTLRDNVDNAKKIALELWEKGFKVFCPAANTDLPTEAVHALNLPDGAILSADIRILFLCDAIVVAPDWENSIGVNYEIKLAKSFGIPIYYYPDLPEIK